MLTGYGMVPSGFVGVHFHLNPFTNALSTNASIAAFSIPGALQFQGPMVLKTKLLNRISIEQSNCPNRERIPTGGLYNRRLH